MPRNIKLIIEYEGTKFHGWQFQPNCRTVQGEIERGLANLTGQAVRIIGSGRTDAGVHAYAQVANFRTESDLPIDKFCIGLNSWLPHDVQIIAAEEADPSFNAMRDACWRHYRYQIIRRSSPLLRRHSWHLKGQFEFAPLLQAVPDIVGVNEFQSFCAKGSHVTDYRVHIREASWCEEGELLVFRVCANRFLYSMVRILVGTFIDMGRGKLPSDAFPDILAAKNRAQASPTAPAQGLFLERVEY